MRIIEKPLILSVVWVTARLYEDCEWVIPAWINVRVYEPFSR